MPDGIDTSIPLIIEFSEDKAKVFYSRKEGRKVSKLVKALGMSTTRPLIVCHECGRKFRQRWELEHHNCKQGVS